MLAPPVSVSCRIQERPGFPLTPMRRCRLEIPALEIIKWREDARGIEDLIRQYLTCTTPLYDSTEAGKRNRPRDRIRWGSGTGFIEMLAPEKVRHNYYEATLTLWLAALYYVPGRPITAVKVKKNAVSIEVTASYSSKVRKVWITWEDPALLPFVEGLTEALGVEWPDVKSEIDAYSSGVHKLKKALQKEAEAELARLSGEYPPDPQQIEQAQKLLIALAYRSVHSPELSKYAEKRGVDIRAAQDHANWPRVIRPMEADPAVWDWDTFNRAARSVIDEMASKGNGAAQGQDAEAEAGSDETPEAGADGLAVASVSLEKLNTNDRGIVDLWSKGRTGGEIANKFGLNPRHVNNRVTELRASLGKHVVPYHGRGARRNVKK